MIAIVFTYSRGTILSLCVFLIPLILVMIKYSKFRYSTLFSLGFFCLIIGVLGVGYCYHYEEKLAGLIDVLLKGITTINGRTPLFDEAVRVFKENIWFGAGLYHTMNGIIEYSPTTFYHSTILHTMACLGVFGLVTLTIHLFQKYYILLKKMQKVNIY